MPRLKLPAQPWFWGDWFKDGGVQTLPPDIRCMWFEMCGFMWESPDRGALVHPNGQAYTDEEVIGLCRGMELERGKFGLTLLLTRGVCGRRESDGAIFSRRIVNDEKKRSIYAEIGKKGGNPALMVNPVVNLNSKNRLTLPLSPGEYENDNGNGIEISDENTGVQGVKEPDPRFLTFWAMYPARRGKKIDKAEALKAFTALKEQDKNDIMIAVKNYAASDTLPKDAHRFIKKDYWRNWMEPEKAQVIPINLDRAVNDKDYYDGMPSERRPDGTST